MKRAPRRAGVPAAATGDSNGAHRTYTYRADVLRYLKIGADGRYIVTDLTIKLPDSGNGNGVPSALGASVVLVYRSPTFAGPLKAVVIYDGGYTINNATPTMTQTIKPAFTTSRLRRGDWQNDPHRGQRSSQ